MVSRVAIVRALGDVVAAVRPGLNYALLSALTLIWTNPEDPLRGQPPAAGPRSSRPRGTVRDSLLGRAPSLAAAATICGLLTELVGSRPDDPERSTPPGRFLWDTSAGADRVGCSGRTRWIGGVPPRWVRGWRQLRGGLVWA
jgi:hypothetical protein